MLSIDQFNKLKEQINSTQNTKKRIIEILWEQYTNKAEGLTGAYKHDRKQNYVNPTRPNSTESTSTPFEKKNAVKIRTEADSSRSDDTRSTRSPKKY